MAVNLVLTDVHGNVILSPMESILFTTANASVTLTQNDLNGGSLLASITGFFSSSSSGTPSQHQHQHQQQGQPVSAANPQQATGQPQARPALPASLSCSRAHVILTNQRFLVISSAARTQNSPASLLHSLAVPLPYLRDPQLGQPLFGANNITGTVLPYPGGGLVGNSSLKIVFNDGGAFELYDALGRAIQHLLQTDLANRHYAHPPPQYQGVPQPQAPLPQQHMCPQQQQQQPQTIYSDAPPPYNPAS